MKKVTAYPKHVPDLDHLMNKFNNSIAIQNMGIYANPGSFMGNTGSNKSRNFNTGTFKTTATLGTTAHHAAVVGSHSNTKSK